MKGNDLHHGHRGSNKEMSPRRRDAMYIEDEGRGHWAIHSWIANGGLRSTRCALPLGLSVDQEADRLRSANCL